MPGISDDRPGAPSDRRAPGKPESSGSSWPADYPGTEEVPVVNWPLLWRERLGRRVRADDRYPRWVLGTTLAGLFASGFAITVVAVSLGEIASDLGTDKAGLTWVVTGPLLAFALVTPLFGKLGDVLGHRRVYLAGFGAFAVAAALTAVAWDAPSLVALRVLGALAGAATGPTSMALIMRAYPAAERVKAMGWWSLIGAGAPVLGLAAGGPVVDTFGWRWIFVAQAVASVAAVVIAAVVLHETPTRPREPIDVAGGVLLAVATLAALLALDRSRVWGWSSTRVIALLVVAPLALFEFVRAERRAPHPLLPLGFFRRRNFTAPLVAQFASNFAYMGGFILTPVLVQDVFGFSVTSTALAMLCRPLAFSLVAPVAGFLAVKVGERITSVVGTALVVVSMVVFAWGAHVEAVGLVFAGLVLSGLGLGVASPSLMSSVANAVDAGDLGVANAAQATVAQIGVVAGIQVLSTIGAAGAGTAPFAAAYLAGGVVATVGIVGAAGVRPAERHAALRVMSAA